MAGWDILSPQRQAQEPISDTYLTCNSDKKVRTSHGGRGRLELGSDIDDCLSLQSPVPPISVLHFPLICLPRIASFFILSLPMALSSPSYWTCCIPFVSLVANLYVCFSQYELTVRAGRSALLCRFLLNTGGTILLIITVFVFINIYMCNVYLLTSTIF